MWLCFWLGLIVFQTKLNACVLRETKLLLLLFFIYYFGLILSRSQQVYGFQLEQPVVTTSTMSQYYTPQDYIITVGIVQRLPFNNTADLTLWVWVCCSHFIKGHFLTVQVYKGQRLRNCVLIDCHVSRRRRIKTIYNSEYNLKHHLGKHTLFIIWFPDCSAFVMKLNLIKKSCSANSNKNSAAQNA